MTWWQIILLVVSAGVAAFVVAWLCVLVAYAVGEMKKDAQS